MLPPVLDRLPVDAVRCYFEPDGTFPNHEPNPLLPENREFIVAKVLEEKADLGIAFDGDADRCFFVDDTGEFVPGDFLTALLAETILEKEPGATVLYDVRASWAVPETIEAAGGTPLVNRVGHAFIKHRMRKEDAVFAGEVSGHYYFRDYFQADSGVVPMLLVLELVSRKGTPMSEILAPFRSQYFLTGEINTPVADVALKLQELKERIGREGEVSHLDGLSIVADRLAHERPPVEHRAAPTPESRGPLARADGAEARRGARGDPNETGLELGRLTDPQAAVQVLGPRTCRLLGHGRPGHRVLRPLHAVLRHRALRVPPPPRPARTDPRRASSSSCARPTSSTMPPLASTTCWRSSCAKRLRGRETTAFAAYRADDDTPMCAAEQILVLIDAEARRPSGSRQLQDTGPRVRGQRPRGSPPMSASADVRRGALDAIDRYVNSEPTGHHVLQRTVDLLHDTFEHYSWIGIYLVEGDDLVLAAWQGPEPTEHVTIPIGEGICGSAAASGKTEVVDDAGADRATSPASLDEERDRRADHVRRRRRRRDRHRLGHARRLRGRRPGVSSTWLAWSRRGRW